MITLQEINKIELVNNYREIWKKETALGGIFSWEKRILKEKIGDELCISMSKIPDNVYINGIEYISK